ncbi:helix-turn-helix domain-containing protein [Bacteroides uniformis]|uniref:Helix-turn-helix domain-containing protein n=1 Tax=Bacteroides uniformis TaxID=820 RepID=A0A6I0LRW8_BACUN|nr:helix-turn-helix domain-containing protein [Bacteroides uniformis]KAB4253919.1 helix-turn-helix domain-containing protein [Bacteroides uniformis]KAB4254003.1 helix-turn-helix domain-containing protein [Bacteroides uniformis]KAB4257571.1 helix-turn-helix domain-containing protein [Bacteroides uniformis]KAB4260159.1 helix-turn-helix domain-containing protein [Bacteroides uniformis]
MSHYFIDKQDPRIADLLRRLEKIDKSLKKLEPSCRCSFNGERFVSDSELSKTLKISRRTLQEYRTARAIPYYLVQGKILYKESEIQGLLEAAHKKCIEEQKWV